jgi:hypothetical protein
VKAAEAAEPKEQTMAKDDKKIFRVKAVQPNPNDAGKKFYSDVGTIVLHDNGTSGTLFLNHLPGVAYALFLKDPSEKED